MKIDFNQGDGLELGPGQALSSNESPDMIGNGGQFRREARGCGFLIRDGSRLKVTDGLAGASSNQPEDPFGWTRAAMFNEVDERARHIIASDLSQAQSGIEPRLAHASGIDGQA